MVSFLLHLEAAFECLLLLKIFGYLVQEVKSVQVVTAFNTARKTRDVNETCLQYIIIHNAVLQNQSHGIVCLAHYIAKALA